MKMMKNSLSSAILATLAVNAPTYGQFEDAGLFSLEEVVVTAERRSQTLQEIPLAVSAITGEAIERAHITRTEDLAAAAPGLQISKGRLGSQRMVIRGIGGSLRDNIAGSPKVAFFVDDVYVSSGAGMDMAFFDLERIEVLRGPQGTLYGKNAIAGAVNVYSNPPSRELEAKASFNLGNYGQRQTRFMIGGPLTESISGKLITGSNERDGFTENIATGTDMSLEESYFGRGSLQFNGESWDIRAIMDYEHNPSNPGTAMSIVGTTGYDILNQGGALGTTVHSPDDPYEVTLDEDGEGSQTQQGFSLSASFEGENFAFDSITGYRDLKNSFSRDIDQSTSDIAFNIAPLVDPSWSPGGPDIDSTVSVINRAEKDLWTASQEFRLSSIDGGAYTFDEKLFWTTGLYLFHMEGSHDEVFDLAFPEIATYFNQKQGMELEGDTIALYGQGTYTLNDKLDIIFGLRYSYETKEAVHYTRDGIPLLVDEDYEGVKIDESWSQVTPKLTANYQLTPEVMVYSTYSKGTLSGGFNFGPSNALEASTLSFDQELADNYEIGIKGSAFENRLQYSVAAFYIQYEDLQVQSISTSGSTTTDNAGSANSQGLEVELKALATEHLALSANYAYVNAKFDEYCKNAETNNMLTGTACIADGGIDTRGNRLEYSSEQVFNLSAEYILGLQDMGDLIFNTNYVYTSEQFFDPANTAGQDALNLLNASIAFESSDGHWYLSLWGKNLTREEYNKDFISYGATPDGVAYIQGAPRTYGATLTWTY